MEIGVINFDLPPPPGKQLGKEHQPSTFCDLLDILPEINQQSSQAISYCCCSKKKCTKTFKDDQGNALQAALLFCGAAKVVLTCLSANIYHN